MVKDVSIEYAHIYSSSSVQAEHELSLQILGNLRQQLSQRGQSSTLLVLVDDYSFPDPTFDYDSFDSWLGGQGYKPDLIFRESQLIPLCDQVIGLIESNKLKSQITQYVQAKKYPCSLFIAAWYLLRLGHLDDERFPGDLQARSLVNILPESFKPFEEQGIEIIKATKYAGAAQHILYQYLDGRLLA